MSDKNAKHQRGAGRWPVTCIAGQRHRAPYPHRREETLARAKGRPAAPACAVMLGLLSAATAFAQPADLASRLDAIIKPYNGKATIGVVVRRLDNGETLYTHEPDAPLKPASVMKLFTTAAALDRFGPNFKLETRVYVHNDDLLIIGGGDPGFGDERLAKHHGREHLYELTEWTDALKTRGITSIQRIAIDDSIFEQKTRNPDWPDDQADRWYQAPVGGVILNDDCIDATLEASGGVVTIHTKPLLPASWIVNNIVAAEKHAPVVSRAIDSDIFVFSGTAAHDDGFRSIACGNPTVFFGYALKRALADAGIGGDPEVVRRRISAPPSDPLAVHATPMEDLLRRTNRNSQNLFAECLHKCLVAYNPDGTRSGTPGSWDEGRKVVRATLEKMGLDTRGAIFRDGSGLSHRNRVSAQQVVSLLTIMHGHRYSQQYLASLAYAGREGMEGSMRSHYADPVLAGKLMGKTGTIDGVHTVAGFIESDHSGTLVFAALINGDAPVTVLVEIAKALVGS